MGAKNGRCEIGPSSLRWPVPVSCGRILVQIDGLFDSGREIEDMVASTRWFIDGLFDSRRKIDSMVTLAHRWTT
jgi:hypothetical protein